MSYWFVWIKQRIVLLSGLGNGVKNEKENLTCDNVKEDRSDNGQKWMNDKSVKISESPKYA